MKQADLWQVTEWRHLETELTEKTEILIFGNPTVFDRQYVTLPSLSHTHAHTKKQTCFRYRIASKNCLASKEIQLHFFLSGYIDYTHRKLRLPPRGTAVVSFSITRQGSRSLFAYFPKLADRATRHCESHSRAAALPGSRRRERESRDWLCRFSIERRSKAIRARQVWSKHAPLFPITFSVEYDTPSWIPQLPSFLFFPILSR